MSSQADDYRHCTPVYYPGFSSLHPSQLPMQNNKMISLSHSIGAVLSCYDEMLLRYGIRSQLPRYLKQTRMKDFIKDAFWWLFLENFVSVDLDLMLQQVKGNTLVNDDDMKAFQFDTVVPTHIAAADDDQCLALAGVSKDIVPTLPLLKPTASIGAPTRHRLRDTAKNAPAHLEKVSQGNRKLEDVALIGSPRCVSALSLAESVEGRPQSARAAQAPAGGDRILSPRNSQQNRSSDVPTSMSMGSNDMNDDTGDDTASNCSTASTVSNAMRVTFFSNTRVQLHKLPQEVRLQIAAKEQHQLFTRMALNYGNMCQETMGMNVALKDAITRLLPEVLAQLMYLLFARAIPYAMRLLDIPFQLSLGQKFSFWIGGVERIYNVRHWGVHAYLDPVKRMRKQSRAASGREASASRRSATHRERGASTKELSSSTTSRNKSATSADWGSRAPAPPSARADSSATPPHELSTTIIIASRKSDSLTLSTPQPPKSPSSNPVGGRSSSDTPGQTALRKPDGKQSPRVTQLVGGLHDTSPRGSDPPASRRSDWSAPVRKSDVAPPSFLVGDAASDALRSVKSMRRPGGLSRKELRSGGGLGLAAFHALGDQQLSAEEAARNQRKEQIVKQDVDAMRAELTKLKTTHTFAQFHYSGHVTRQVPTFRDTDVEIDPTSGKLAGVEERLPSRIAQAFVIGPKKRNIQVIKKDLDAKFLSNPPWYAGKNQRIPIKEHADQQQKFALNNWSPLLHRFMIANGEDNLRPVEVMNWTS